MEILEKRGREDSSVHFLPLGKHKYLILWVVKVE